MSDLLLRDVPTQFQADAVNAGNAFTELEREPGIANRQDFIVAGNLYRCYGNKRGTLVEFKGAASEAPKIPTVLDSGTPAAEAEAEHDGEE